MSVRFARRPPLVAASPPGATSLPDLSIEALRALAAHPLGRRGLLRPDVAIVERDGERAVLKDYGDRGARSFVGRFLVAREACAYAALAGERGVPELLARPGKAALLLAWRDAGPLGGRGGAGVVSEKFHVELARLVERLHARGVAHLDLRGRRNVLVDRSGLPVIVDFGASVVARSGPIAKLAFPFLRAVDRGAVLKHRRRYRPRALVRAERRADFFFSALGRLWRIVRLH